MLTVRLRDYVAGQEVCSLSGPEGRVVLIGSDYAPIPHSLNFADSSYALKVLEVMQKLGYSGDYQFDF